MRSILDKKSIARISKLFIFGGLVFLCITLLFFVNSFISYQASQSFIADVKNSEEKLSAQQKSICTPKRIGQPRLDVTLIRVIDGDTIEVMNPQTSKVLSVRLIGIDTPEIAHSNSGKDQPFGQKAKQYLSLELEGKTIYLVYDKSPTDAYGRTLAYVFTQSNELVNCKVILYGFAKSLNIQPNDYYKQTFDQALDASRSATVGLWAQ